MLQQYLNNIKIALYKRRKSFILIKNKIILFTEMLHLNVKLGLHYYLISFWYYYYYYY